MELVGPPVDYTDAPAVPTRKTHPWLSHYVVQTVEFMNRFACVCEQKLCEMSRQLEKLEVTMSFLEAKLNSVPGLEGAVPAAVARPEEPILPSITGTDIAGGDMPSFSFNDGASVMNVPAASAPVPAAAPTVPTLPPVDAGPKVKDDPKYEKYFKMLRLGVPEPQIRQKMVSDGLDPDVLSNPDAPASSVGGGHGGDDDDIFSDASNDSFSD